MLAEGQTTYYLAYALICAALGVTYIKVKSTEGVTITTKEFKIFQTGFLTAFSAMMLGELLCLASFFPTFSSFDKMDLEKVTRLYIVTVVATTAFGVLLEIVDLGSRKDKCVLAAILYAVSMVSILLFGGHFETLLLSRVVYGAASSLHHSAFELYAIHEHATQGFPDDWLTFTFSVLAHVMALVAALSGTIGQTAASSGALGCVSLACAVFVFSAVYITFVWAKDMASPRFMLSGFLFNLNQTYQAAKSSKHLQLVLLISTLCESAIVIFTFYWAPWLASMVSEEDQVVPYEVVYSALVSASMLGNYLYQVYGGAGGVGGAEASSTFQAVLIATSACFSLGAIFQTPVFAFFISVAVQLCIGGYWPSIGALRGRVVVPELRGTALSLARSVGLLLLVALSPRLSFFSHAKPTSPLIHPSPQVWHDGNIYAGPVQHPPQPHAHAVVLRLLIRRRSILPKRDALHGRDSRHRI